MGIDIEQLTPIDKSYIVNLYFSRLLSSDDEYKKRNQYYEAFVKRYGFKHNLLRNNQDRLDPLFTNGRKGWHQKPLEKQNKRLYEIYLEFMDTPRNKLKEWVDKIMDSLFEGEKVYYSIRTKDPEIVKKILNKEQFIEVCGLNIFKDQLHLNQILFIVLGGDKSQSSVTWNTGLIGLGRIVQEPYDVGYSGKNFKVKIDVELLLDSPITRENLVPYRNTYNIIGIGPMTKWEPNQAISQIEENKTITLVRAVIDNYPDRVVELEAIFGPEFMVRVRGENEYLLPRILPYNGSLPDTVHEDDIEYQVTPTYFDPDIETVKFNFQMDISALESFKNYINIGKHIILTGPPGTGKTTIAERFAKEASRTSFIGGHIVTTATADWTTFDTIGGYMPDIDGKLEFQEGIVLRSLRENKWLIIDEINRAEVDKAFGQLFTILSGKDVQLPFRNNKNNMLISIRCHKGLPSFYNEDSSTYFVGQNWRIIATMNTYDKNSLFTLSYAFMRRFAFINIPIPELGLIEALIESSELEADSKKFVRSIFESSPKPIGPAVINELIDFLILTEGSKKIEGLCGLVIPQFEGLPYDQIKQFYKCMGNFITKDERGRLQEYLLEFFDMKNDSFKRIEEELENQLNGEEVEDIS